VQLGGEQLPVQWRVVRAGDQRGRFRVGHLGALAHEREDLHTEAQALEPEDLVQDERLGDQREARHEMSDRP
jgi:hypothetical protein